MKPFDYLIVKAVRRAHQVFRCKPHKCPRQCDDAAAKQAIKHPIHIIPTNEQ